jgi:hypothetical protein
VHALAGTGEGNESSVCVCVCVCVCVYMCVYTLTGMGGNHVCAHALACLCMSAPVGLALYRTLIFHPTSTVQREEELLVPFSR